MRRSAPPSSSSSSTWRPKRARARRTPTPSRLSSRRCTFYLSIIGFVVQVGLTSRIHRSLGLGFALLILPVSLGATATLILLNGALWAPAAARVLDTSLRYTIDKTTREMLFLPLPADLKYRAKPFVDVTVDRFAKALGALLLLVLIKPWGLGPRLAAAELREPDDDRPCGSSWRCAPRREYLKAFRRSIDGAAMAPATVRLDVADSATIETLVEELANPDESRVLYAIDMLESLDKRNLDHAAAAAPRVARGARARARGARVGARRRSRGRWTPGGRAHAEGRGRRRAGRGGARAGGAAQGGRVHADAAASARRRPRVAVTAAVALADSGDEADAHAAEATLKRLIEDTRRRGRRRAQKPPRPSGAITNPRFRPLLVPLMYDATSTSRARPSAASSG